MIDMSETPTFNNEGGSIYQIKIKGYLDLHWADWLGGLEISHDVQGNSLLTGMLPDQSALHGILVQIRDLGMPLISLSSQPGTVEGKENADGRNIDSDG
jgi:hypothetical protein